MKKGFLFLVTLAITGVILWSCSDDNTTNSTSDDNYWIKVFGRSDDERGYSVQQTTDNGFIITGRSGTELCLIKTDSKGIEEWLKILLSGSVGWSVEQTEDGGYIVAGAKYSDGYDKYIYLVKTDSIGNEVWSKLYDQGIGYSVQQTSDGGFILTGVDSVYDVCLIKTDSIGNEVWKKSFGAAEEDDCGMSVQQTSDGGFIISGWISDDACLIKTDENGNEMWTKTYGGNAADGNFSVQQTTDGGYITIGRTKSYGGGGGYADVYLIKADENGNEIWFKTFGGSADDWGLSVQQTSDHGYIISGLSGLGSDLYLIKTDESGNEIWSKIYGDKIGGGYSVKQTIDGGYIITGDIDSEVNYIKDLYLIKTDSSGNF
jgi:hypothetical protein